MNHFVPSVMPEEGTGVLFLFHLVDRAVPAFFAPDRPLTVARAPGRIDVMGGHGPQAGPLLLQWPIAEAACVAVQDRPDDAIHVWSPGRDESRSQLVSTRLADLGLPDWPLAYAAARAAFAVQPRERWAAHVLGCLLVLAHERGLRPERGLALLLRSDVPEGAGLASSAAVEVAVMAALARHFGLQLGASELAQLCSRVEREVVGEEPLLVDHVAAASAEADELLVVRRESGALDGSIPVPAELEVIGIDSGVRGGRRAGASAPAGTDEAAVRRFAALLLGPLDAAARTELGDLMFAAHADYVAAGLSHPATDFLVDQVRARRAAGAPLLGARATGRGGGGTVVVLGERGKVWHEALRIKKALLAHTGLAAEICRWSSPGAQAFGTLTLQPRA